MQKIDFSFELITQDEKARLGKIYTRRGEIDTPVFMPVGTQGTVKGIFVDDILTSGSQIILGNTYHFKASSILRFYPRQQSGLDQLKKMPSQMQAKQLIQPLQEVLHFASRDEFHQFYF